MTKKGHTVEFSLEPEYSRTKEYEEETESEDLTNESSDSLCKSSENEEEDTVDEVLVVMIKRDLVDFSDGVSGPYLEEEVVKKLSTVNENIRGRLETM